MIGFSFVIALLLPSSSFSSTSLRRPSLCVCVLLGSGSGSGSGSVTQIGFFLLRDCVALDGDLCMRVGLSYELDKAESWRRVGCPVAGKIHALVTLRLFPPSPNLILLVSRVHLVTKQK